jgi:hypothetical protein
VQNLAPLPPRDDGPHLPDNLQSALAAEAEGLDAPLAELERKSPAYRLALRIGLPVFTSLVIHALLLLVLAFTTWEVLRRVQQRSEYVASLTETSGGAGENFQWSSRQFNTAVQTRGDFADPTLDLTKLGKAEMGVGDKQASEQLGFRPGQGRGADFGIGSGRSGILGSGVGGIGGAGKSGLAGAGSGRGIGSAGMWGRTLVANRVVFVLDYSGSIIVAVDDLKRELKRSIGSLRPTQSFNVIIFYSDEDRFRTESFAADLQPATHEVREKFFAWIDSKSPQGRTEPLAALRRAIRMEPDAIFLLSDGDFEDRVVSEIRSINKRGTKICCLVFDELLLSSTGDTPPTLNANARRLRQIAEDSQGWMMIVTARELRRAR